MQKEGRTYGGKNIWRGYTNEETIKQRNIEMEGTVGSSLTRSLFVMYFPISHICVVRLFVFKHVRLPAT